MFSATCCVPRPKHRGIRLREVLDNVFAAHADARGYVLDDQSGLWRHMAELGLSPCARMKLRAKMPEDLGKFRGLLAGYDDGPA
jgi:hypothetical protein